MDSKERKKEKEDRLQGREMVGSDKEVSLEQKTYPFSSRSRRGGKDA